MTIEAMERLDYYCADNALISDELGQSAII